MSVKDGIVNVESTIQITEGLSDKIKANPKKVKAILKDLKIEHFLSITEDGTIISKTGKQLSGCFDPMKEGINMQRKHKFFLDQLESLDEEENPLKEKDFDNEDCSVDTDDENPIFGILLIPMCI